MFQCIWPALHFFLFRKSTHHTILTVALNWTVSYSFRSSLYMLLLLGSSIYTFTSSLWPPLRTCEMIFSLHYIGYFNETWCQTWNSKVQEALAARISWKHSSSLSGKSNVNSVQNTRLNRNKFTTKLLRTNFLQFFISIQILMTDFEEKKHTHNSCNFYSCDYWRWDVDATDKRCQMKAKNLITTFRTYLLNVAIKNTNTVMYAHMSLFINSVIFIVCIVTVRTSVILFQLLSVRTYTHRRSAIFFLVMLKIQIYKNDSWTISVSMWIIYGIINNKRNSWFIAATRICFSVFGFSFCH